MAEVIAIARELILLLGEVKNAIDKRTNNLELMEEIDLFVAQLQRDIDVLEEMTPRNNSSAMAAESLKRHLEEATKLVQVLLRQGCLEGLWNANHVQEQLSRVRENLMTEFQTLLQYIQIDVPLDGRNEQARFRQSLKRLQNINEALGATNLGIGNLADSVTSMRQEARSERRTILKLLGKAMGEQQKRDAAHLVLSIQAQTTETEKFFADVVQALETHREEVQVDEDMYEDPITRACMCDPVKATDGRTYDRWTIIDNNMVRCPYDADMTDFRILVDDIDMRRRLFLRFPEQEEEFRARRQRHRQEALDHVAAEEYGDALLKLDHVMMWDSRDRECALKRDWIRDHLQPMRLDDKGAMRRHPDVLLKFREDGGAVSSSAPEHLLIYGHRCCQDTFRRLPGYYYEACFQAGEHISVGFLIQQASGAASAAYGTWMWKAHPLHVVATGLTGRLSCCFELERLEDEEVYGAHPLETMQCGDTIGVGVNFKSREIFFTKNGELRWFIREASITAEEDAWTPMCTINQAEMEVNFGEKPFLYPWETHFPQSGAGTTTVIARPVEVVHYQDCPDKAQDEEAGRHLGSADWERCQDRSEWGYWRVLVGDREETVLGSESGPGGGGGGGGVVNEFEYGVEIQELRNALPRVAHPNVTEAPSHLHRQHARAFHPVSTPDFSPDRRSVQADLAEATVFANRLCPRSFRGLPGYYFEAKLLSGSNVKVGVLRLSCRSWPSQMRSHVDSDAWLFLSSHPKRGLVVGGRGAVHNLVSGEFWGCLVPKSTSAARTQKRCGQTMKCGDVVGCGINFKRGEVFFTVNGCLAWLLLLCEASVNASYSFLPFCALPRGGGVHLNFGQDEFRFHLGTMFDLEMRRALKGTRASRKDKGDKKWRSNVVGKRPRPIGVRA